VADVGRAGEGFLREPGLWPETRGFETVNMVIPITQSCVTLHDDSVIRFADKAGVLALGTVLTLPTNNSFSNKWLNVQTLEVKGISTGTSTFNQVP
jgi:hypothetical protein